MAVDEQRLERLEAALKELSGQVRQALDRPSPQADRGVAEQVRRLEEEFSEDELKMIRDHRAYGQFRSLMDTWLEEVEEEAEREFRKAGGSDEGDDDEGDGDEGDDDEGESGGKGKSGKAGKGDRGDRDSKASPPKPKPAKRPPGRHEPEGEGGEGGDDLPGAGGGEPPKRHWLFAD